MPYVHLKKINKNLLDPLLAPAMRYLYLLGLRPLHLTLLGLVSGVLGVALLYAKPLHSLPLLLFYLVCDTLDGVMARSTQTQTPLGQYLDYNVDRLIAVLFLLNYYHHTRELLLPATGLLVLGIIWLKE
ncbi:MAG: hypothetical protein GF334_12030 [Candidatus Altiarchaeales archaeon]|nr:hypothetical protein [Candidatus Altiarchaeales archaeon]